MPVPGIHREKVKRSQRIQVANQMEKAKEQLLNVISYFNVLALALGFLGFAAMGGYLYGSAQTAKAYDDVFKDFTDNVEARQVFYFCGYKVIPKEKVVVVKVKPQQLADLAELRDTAIGGNIGQIVADGKKAPDQQKKQLPSIRTVTQAASIPY